MNWTGGSLQRSKSNRKGIAQKQKAHFARARTQLQTGPRSSSPFRPNFFDNSENNSGSRPPLFPFRRAGHSTPLQEQDRASHRRKPCDPRRRTALTVCISGSCRKRSEDSTDVQERLLESRKKRLLQRDDWVGLTRWELPELQFRSAEQKSMIGKRRKLKDHRVLAVIQKANVQSRQRDAKTSTREVPYMSGPLPIEDISIRIGSDALTSAVPQTSSSSESSITMLFDNEDLHTAPILPPARIEDHGPRTFVGAHQQPEMRVEGSQSVHTSNPSQGPSESGKRYIDYQHIHIDPEAALQEEDRISGCYLAEHVGGVTRPLRLVFDRTSDSLLSINTDVVPQSYVIGETSHGYAPAKARLHEKSIARKQPVIRYGDSAGQPQITDDGPWKSFLRISGESSSIATAAFYQSSRSAHREKSAEVGAWSQHATQGNETHIRFRSVSSSLPSITRYSDIEALEGRPHTKGERGKQMDEVEDKQLWETYLDYHQSAASKTGNEEVVENETTAASCNAVKSLSSTPFRWAAGLTTCISHSVQDTAARAPLSTLSGPMLPRITSSDAPLKSRFFNKGGSGTGDQSSEYSGFGAHSATQTSIQNNVSYYIDACTSRNLGVSKARATCNGLSWGRGCTTDGFEPQVQRCEPPSVYGIPVSDEGY